MCLLGQLYFGPLLVPRYAPKLLLCLHFRFRSISLKLLGEEQPNLTGGIFRGPRCAFWGNCTLAHFWCRTIHQNYFNFTLAHISQTTGWRTIKFDGGIFRGLRCAFLVNVLWPTFGAKICLPL